MPRVIRAADRALARHRIRHTPSGFDCVIADRVGYLDASAWDHLTNTRSIFMSRRYLAILESHGPSNIAGRYALVYRAHEPLAAIAAQRVTISTGQIEKRTSSTRRKAVRAMTSPFKNVTQHMLVCGNLLSWGNHGLAVAPNANKEVVGGIADALYRIRRAEKLAAEVDFVMIKDIAHEDEAFAQRLRTWSYRRLETEPNMVLSVNPRWRCFDDYLQALTSTYRKNARRIFKEVDAAGIEMTPLRLDPSHAAALHQLYLQVHDAAAIRLFTLRDSYLPALAQAFGDDFRCTAAMKDGALVGFITTVKDHETAVAYYIGFDRTFNETAPLYFRLLYAAIADAIALGCREISFGRTALEPKARLGAQPQPTSVYLRHRVPLLNLIVRAAIKGIHHDDAPRRDPFKQERD